MRDFDRAITGNTDEGQKAALMWVTARLKKNQRILVSLPSKSATPEDGPLADAIAWYPSLFAISYPRKPAHSWDGGPVISYCETERAIHSHERSPYATCLCVIQFSETDTQAWEMATSPSRLVDVQGDVEPLELDPVVIAALEDMTAMVNLSTGLANSSDKSVAIISVKRLHAGGYDLPVETIKAWCLRNGWKQSGISDLERIISDTIKGKRLRATNPGILKEDILQQWERKASETH